jgi:transposase
MGSVEREVARKAKAMTRNEVIVRAMSKQITWIQAALICGVSERQMRRLKRRYESNGYSGLVDGRGGKPRRKRIAMELIEQLCSLKRERYPDFSVQHFWEKLGPEHGITISYTWTKLVLQAAGIVPKHPGRGQYRRRRERRPLVGMMVHLDGSRHAWLPDLPAQDLIVAMDDADGRILYARFVPEEGTASTFAALKHILKTHGRFAELYSDRGSHFCRTPHAGAPPTTEGEVSRALKVLGIRQILAWSPQARGRSERGFGTIQGRLPQELRVAGTTTYEQANVYLQEVFVPDFNRRFTVTPTENGSAFLPLVGVDLELLLSVQHTRTVQNDSTVSLRRTVLQLPRTADRLHYVRCAVTVHEFPEGTLGISYQGRLLATYREDGELLNLGAPPSLPRRSSHAGGDVVPPRSLPAPPRPTRKGPHPATPRSARQRAKTGATPHQRSGHP